MTRPFIIAVGGENLIDQVTTDGNVISHAGGSPFNVAVAIARQGANVRYVSPVSTDSWGELLANRLIEAGVTLTGDRNDRPTTMARVTITNGIPDYFFERDGTAERAVDTAALTHSIGTDVNAVHTGSLTLIDGPDADAWEETLSQIYNKGGVLVSLDPNVRLSIITDIDGYRDRIKRILTHIHVLKLSDEDLSGLFPDMDEQAAIAHLRNITSAQLLVLTRGPDGISAWVRSHRIDLPVPRPDPLIDTVGAGDTFMATLLVGLGGTGYIAPKDLTTLPPETATQILQRAASAAALNCQREGCNPPTLADLNAHSAQ